MPGMMLGGGGSASTEKPAEKSEPEPVKEKEAFDIKLGAVDAKSKIKVIKEIRTITGLGLKEVTICYISRILSLIVKNYIISQAKELVEKAPVVVKQGVKKEEVEALKKLLVDAGATVEVL